MHRSINYWTHIWYNFVIGLGSVSVGSWKVEAVRWSEIQLGVGMSDWVRWGRCIDMSRYISLCRPSGCLDIIMLVGESEESGAWRRCGLFWWCCSVFRRNLWPTGVSLSCMLMNALYGRSVGRSAACVLPGAFSRRSTPCCGDLPGVDADCSVAECSACRRAGPGWVRRLAATRHGTLGGRVRHSSPSRRDHQIWCLEFDVMTPQWVLRPAWHHHHHHHHIKFVTRHM